MLSQYLPAFPPSLYNSASLLGMSFHLQIYNRRSYTIITTGRSLENYCSPAAISTFPIPLLGAKLPSIRLFASCFSAFVGLCFC